MAAAILLLLALVSIWLALAAPGYVKMHISAYIRESSKGEYSLSFYDIKANFYTQTVRIDSIRLIPLQAGKSHYAVAASELRATGISISDFLFHRKLSLNGLLIKEPQFEIYGQKVEQAATTNKADLFRKLKPFFNESLNEITVDEILLEQANMAQYTLQGDTSPLNSIPNLNIAIRNFRMNAQILNAEKQFFQADDIDVQIKNFSHALGDKIHRLQVETLSYSIEHRNIRGHNLRLYPLDTAQQAGTRYWIEIPEIKIKSENLRDMLSNDSVRIDSLEILHSNIRLKPGINSQSINFRELKKYDLYQLVKNDFRYAAVNHLRMSADTLCFLPKTDSLNNSQIFRNVEIKADQFELAPNSRTAANKILYSDLIELQIGSYRLMLNDQVHQFEARDIHLSSADRFMKARELKLTPNNNTTATAPVKVKMLCDSLTMQQLDLAALFHRRQIPLAELNLYHPTVQINQLAEHTAGEASRESLLYHFIRDYIKGVYANLIAINNGQIQFNDLSSDTDEGHITTDFNLRLTDFSLDSVSARRTDKLFFATNLELNCNKYTMKLADQLHILKVDQISVSSLRKMARLKNLRLYPNNKKDPQKQLKRLNRSELYELYIPELLLQNTDIHHAFFRKKLNINEFIISCPDISLDVFAGYRQDPGELNAREFYLLLENYIRDINIREIAINQGNLHLTNHSRKGKTTDFRNQFSLKLFNFRLNKEELSSKRMLFSDSFNLKIKDHLFRLSDNVHYLKAREINFSSATSSGEIKHALLYPELSSPDYNKLPWHFQISIPSIKLNQVNLEKAIFDEILDVGSFTVQSPNIQLYKNHPGNGKFNFKDLSIPLPEELKELTLNEVSLQEGQLLIFRGSGDNKQRLASAKLSFNIENAQLKRTEDNRTARFSASAIQTQLDKLSLTPEKQPYSISSDNIRFSSRQKALFFTNLQIKNTSKETKSLESISLPELRFEQLDPSDAFDNNRFHASRITVQKPVFNLHPTEQEQKQNPLYIKLPKDLSVLMDELSSEKVELKNATFNIYGKNKSVTFNQVDIDMDRVKLDSMPSEKPLGAQDLTIVRKNMQYTDKAGLYDLLIDRFAYSTKENDLYLNGIHIIPRYGPDEFQNQIQHQQDYYSGDINQVKLRNLDLNRWFERKELTGKTIAIDRMNMVIYRDKRKPFDEHNKPPLPQELLRSIELPFYFDTVRLSHSNFIYNEQLENIPEPGRVSFEDISAQLYPFTNLKYLQFTTPKMYLKAQARLMGESQLKASFKFDMTAADNRFEAKGSLSPFDLTTLNPITENGASISVRSGQLNRFDFEFAGDSLVANGKLRFAYEDLKISILSHKKGNTKEAKFLSFLANSLLLKSKSPRTKILLPDDIHFYRDPHKSTLNYWWKSVFSGAKNTFGVKDE
ncbi:hypothetical protein [Mangrovibacterium marinum]|uniref:hypothetical protein n=1 Tax=Mangrovibacterium marinum TaxID=1639118 RepID=UPI0011B1D5EB|nr:hypothetical protein [Mangrovibacterium marinum]